MKANVITYLLWSILARVDVDWNSNQHVVVLRTAWLLLRHDPIALLVILLRDMLEHLLQTTWP
jgi:hypothetical protein